MTSITYDDVYSKFYTKVEAFDFLYEGMSDNMVAEFMSSWLRSAIAYPYIRRLFSSVSIDAEEDLIEFELLNSLDEFSDAEFVKEVLAYGMIYSWLEPKVRSITNIYQNFTSSEQKYYSQASHLSELRSLLSDSEARIRSLIRDRGYVKNKYLDGDMDL